MIFLIGSIILTSYLTLAFKVVERFRIPVLQAIVFNHAVCVIEGSFVNGSFPINEANISADWFPWALLMGLIFVTAFNIMGNTIQKLGVAIASVSNKLSLVIPFLFSIYLYNEKATALKIIGVIVAVVAVFFTCWPDRTERITHKKASGLLHIILPLILFLLSGLLDTQIKFVEHSFLNEDNKNDFLITAFAAAASIGGLALLYLILTGKQKFNPKSLIAGVLIGIPNYFSIWCLFQVLKDNPGNSSAIIPINNMGIVLFSSVAAWLLFKEKLTVINWLGILLAIGAIALIAFG